MRILAFDTACGALSAALWAEDSVRFAVFQRRRRGHAEALMPLLERVLDAAGTTPAQLDAVAVTLGPGTFTGLRIGLAAARGFRVALGIPVIGLSTLEALAAGAARRWPDRPVLAAIDARRDQVYVQYFRRAGGPFAEAWTAPAAMPAAAAAAMLSPGTALAGSGAALVAAHCGAAQPGVLAADMEPDARDIARIAASRGPVWRGAPPPAPIYLRQADATPARPRPDR
ncbi:MAG: tRNA N6-adenosine(37)-N6-threonylcarbamoyltransferase complex dimerization subunit TsaB [Rhizobiales bacterium NRL2]|nr:MAG: tRNA N6-adenosine(37)-N6-threonylcarbamoyltransferase complex dimerization subunit TsaB [Rhizobiales bacterium NRL2]